METSEPIISSSSSSDVTESPVGSPEKSATVQIQPPNHEEVVVVSDDFKQKIIKQVEYYFSDENLPTDKFMRKQIKRDKEGFVRLSIVASFKKMKELTTDHSIIESALKDSSQLILSHDEKRVKRRHPFLVAETKDPKLCTVLVENLPEDHSTENLQRIFGEIGIVRNLCVLDPHAVNEIANGGKKGNEKMISAKLHALVEYETVEAAEKAVATLNNDEDWRNGLRVKLLKHVKSLYGKKTWREAESEKTSNTRGPNQFGNSENQNSSKHHAGNGENHNLSKHQAGHSDNHNVSKHKVGHGENHNLSKHQAGNGDNQNVSKHTVGHGENHNLSKHRAGNGDNQNVSKHMVGHGGNHNRSNNRAGHGELLFHFSSKHQAGYGETHNSSKHKAGHVGNQDLSEQQAGQVENQDLSKHQTGHVENQDLGKHQAGNSEVQILNKHNMMHNDEDGEQLQKEKAGKRSRRRGGSRGQKYHSNNGHGTGHGHGTTSNIHGIEISKPPPGPKMPDGTRGFAMGRGRPPVTNQN